MAVIDSKLYVTGGYTDGPNLSSKSGEVLDLATMQWSELPEMATSRSGHGKVLSWAYRPSDSI